MYKNVHQIPTYIQKMNKLHKNCANFRLKTAWNLKYMIFIHKIQTMYKLYKTYTNSSLKQSFYVFCTYRLYANYTKCIQMLIESYTLLLMYAFLHLEKPYYILCFSNFRINNDAIFCSFSKRCKTLESIFSYSKRSSDAFML